MWWQILILANTYSNCHDHHITALGRMFTQGWMRVWAQCNVPMCVNMRKFSNLLHHWRTQGKSQASSGMYSILFHKQLLIYGHLPSFCSVALHPLPEHYPPSHRYTLLLMLVSYGQRQEWLFSVQEEMWLILIWSPVLMTCIHDQQDSWLCTDWWK